MSTFLTMQTRIANEIVRSNMNARIQEAIQSAISFYENDRFYFNEFRPTNPTTPQFSTVSGQAYYTSSDWSDIPYLLEIDSAVVNIASGQRYDLTVTTQEAIDALAVGTTSDEGQPVSYAYYARALRIYPTPDGVYGMYFSGVKKLAALSADADTNAWMVEGEELIRCRAKWSLYTHNIGNLERAGAMKAAEMDALRALQNASGTKLSTNTIVATAF